MHRTAAPCVLTCLLGITLLFTILGAQPAVAIAPETPTRVPVLSGVEPTAAPTIRVLEQNDHGVRLEFELPAATI